ncbi:MULTISPECIES: hypothetical protein [Lelliottia]|uniref:hypothetical protein n=1 Tax=Lelliottia TaxID=1330545 RepID=UPI0012E36736|nr:MULTISPECIES: hypothetical protein [Lelliottia]USR61454.1 hypothetical protein NFJ01_03435 [Lelliottia amnigena]
MPRQRWRWLAKPEIKNECKLMHLLHAPLKNEASTDKWHKKTGIQCAGLGRVLWRVTGRAMRQ